MKRGRFRYQRVAAQTAVRTNGTTIAPTSSDRHFNGDDVLPVFMRLIN